MSKTTVALMLSLSMALSWAVTGIAAEPVSSPIPALVVVNQDDSDEGHEGSVTFLHPDSLAPLAHVEAGRRPIWAGYGPGQQHLFVLNSGKGGWASPGSYGLESSLTVIDVALRRKVASIELAPFSRRVAHSADPDHMFVLSAGKKETAASVQRIDLEKYEITGTIELGEKMAIGVNPERQWTLLSPSGRVLFVLRSPPELPPNPFYSKKSNAPSQLVAIDLVKFETAARLTLGSRAAQILPSSDGKLIYILSRGHTKPKKSQPERLGKIFVVDGETGEEVTTIDTGTDASMWVEPETGLLFVYRPATPSTDAALVIVDGATVAVELATRGRPTQVLHVPGSDQLLVLSRRAIMRVDRGEWKSLETISLPGQAAQMVLSADGRRGYVAEADKGRCMVVDLERGRFLTVLDSGRDSVKTGQAVGKALEWLLFFVDDLPPAPIASARPTVALTHDDRHLLILNQRTDDVTVYDTAELKVKDKVATGKGSRALISSNSGEYHYVLSNEHLTVFPDADPTSASNHWIRQKGRLNVFADEQRGELWVPGKSAVEIFELSTGEPKTTVEGIARPSFVVRWPEEASRPQF